MAIALKGDFIGFSFNGYRSEDLGIVRVSDGSRYNEDLLPTSQDKTVQVPGGDGFYYFGSDYTQKQISINIAFDNLNEADFRKLQQVFGTKELGKLIFDEKPYKYYMVKSGKPQLKYICFGKEGERTYKGEGTLSFIAYYPYAKSVYKFLNEYENSNKNEWAEASGMKVSGIYDIIDKTNKLIPLWNAGDLETDFLLKFEGAITSKEGLQININPKIGETVGNKAGHIRILPFDLKSNDTGFQINTKTNLIEGIDNKGATGTLYNAYISEGDFFKIPLGQSQLSFDNLAPIEIIYDYIYY